MSDTSLEPGALIVPFSSGDVIADKYEIVGLLGSGGVAYVMSALHLELGEMVARFSEVVRHVAEEVGPELTRSEPITSTPIGGLR